MTDNLGTLIRNKRDALGLSRRELADLTGLTVSAIARVELHNKFKPGESMRLQSWLDGAPQTPSRPLTVAATIVDAPIQEAPAEVISPPPLLELPQPSRPLIALPSLSGAEESPTVMTARDGFRRYSNSEIQTAKRCRRKWWLTYYRRLVPKYESPVGARAIGDRIHRALRFWYLAEPELRVDPRDALETLIAIDRRSLEATMSGSPEWDDEVKRAELIKQHLKDADLERIMVNGYMEWLTETGADSEYEIVGSEVYLEADVPGLEGIKIIARLDARVKRTTDGVRFYLDHKTVGDFTQPTRTLHMDEQMLMYLLIERLQPLDDSYVAGAVYNMIKRSKRTARATPPFYKRVEQYHNPTTIQSFSHRLYGTLQVIESMRWRLDQGEHHRVVAYPSPTRDCTWYCPFFQACGMMDDGSHVEGLIRELFNEGDPLRYYVKDDTSQQENLT